MLDTRRREIQNFCISQPKIDGAIISAGKRKTGLARLLAGLGKKTTL